jgi:phasin family protein
MAPEIRNIAEEYQRFSKNGFDMAVRSLSEMNRGFRAVAAEVTDYSKKTLEDSFRAWERLIGAKSVGHMMEIQSEFARSAYDAYFSEMSKLGEMYFDIARNASKPAEEAASSAAAAARRAAA